jgi:hypothetical protein
MLSPAAGAVGAADASVVTKTMKGAQVHSHFDMAAQ